MDIDVYCPKEILEQAGPMFGDTESIQEVYDEFISTKVCGSKIADLCRTCGYPCCDCDSCGVLNTAKASGTKTRPECKHTCALQHCALGAPPKGGPYDLEMKSKLIDAWALKGVFSTPSFVKVPHAGSGFFLARGIVGQCLSSLLMGRLPKRSLTREP